MLDEAADYLTDDGLLIVEVGESEHALAALLPEVPFMWIEFKVGAMGVFALNGASSSTRSAAADRRIADGRRRQCS
jgi:ribosomal protein L3 glutamine methyltransferase